MIPSSRPSNSSRNSGRSHVGTDSATLSPQFEVLASTSARPSGRTHLSPRFASAQSLGGVTRNLSDAKRLIHNEVCSIRPTVREPWIDERGDVVWNSWRLRIGKVMQDKRTEQTLAIIIFFNVVLIMFETNQEAKCFPEYRHEPDLCPTAGTNWISLTILNNSLLILYSVEALLNMYAFRLGYFKKRMCLFDLTICLGGWFSLVLGSLIKISWLRILRCGRILKALHFISSIPELYMLFTGFVGSMKAMFFGALILAGLLCFFSILTVQLIHPINADIDYERLYGKGVGDSCSKAFANIERSMLTLFQQIVAGDSWGLVSIPIIHNSPRMGLMLPFIQLVIGVGAMNLILAVVVDRAVEARETNREQLVLIRAEDQKIRKLELLKLVRSMDTNQNGMIDHSEMMTAARHSNDFINRLRLVGVTEEELEMIVDAIEQKDTGEFGYLDFCNVLDDVEASDIRKTVVLVKMNLAVMKRDLLEKLDKQDRKLERIHSQTQELLRLQRLRPEDTNSDVIRQSPPSDDRRQGKTSLSSSECSVSVHHSGTTPRSLVSPTCSAFTDDIRSCETKALSETARLRQIVLELDACWNSALHIAQKASSSFVEAKAPNGIHLDHAEKRNYLCGHVIQQFCETLRDSHLRCNRVIEDYAKDFEENMISLVRHCNICAGICSGSDSQKAECQLNRNCHEVNLPQPSSTLSARTSGPHLTRI